MPVFTPNLTMAIPVMVIISLIIGIDVGWGYIQVYMASYLHSYSPSITTSKVHMLYSVMDLGQIIGAQIFEPVTSKLGYRESLSLALLLTATGAFICSIATTIWGFIIPVVLMGIAIALRSLACSFFMVELLPGNYAFAVGLGNIGCAFSAIFWSWVPLLVVNPDNATADIEIREYSRTAYYFGEAVTIRVPYLFQVITIIATVAVL